MSDPRAGSRKGMRDGFFPSMGVSGGNVGVGGAGVSGWGRVQAKECGRALDRSGGDGTGMEE